MNRLKILLIVPCLIISQLNYGQMAGTTISKQEYNSISKSVKIYAYNPTYSLRVNWALCTYEIYVNDMLVDFSFAAGRSAGEQNIDFPQYILKSGVQKIKVRVYPQATINGKTEPSLSPDAVLSVRVAHSEYGKGTPKEVYHDKLPAQTKKIGTYEWSGKFLAEVPYTLNGWSSGIDLRKEDPKVLVKEVQTLVNRYITAFKKKDVQTIANMIYNREKEVAQAFFFISGKPNNYDHGWERLEQEMNGITEMKLLNGYSMRISGDGKVVTLLQSSGGDRDFPAIYSETKDKENFYGLYLYRPKSGARLEVIR